jgi:hypothetical protein
MVTKKEILDGLKAAVLGLQVGDPAAAAFTSDGVKYFTRESLSAAMEELLVFEDRACFLVPGGTDYRNERAGAVLKTRKSEEMVLLVTDRVYGDRQASAEGNEDTMGVWALADALEDLLTGHRLGLEGVLVEVAAGEPFTLASEEREDLAGRECWALTVKVSAGEKRVNIGR